MNIFKKPDELPKYDSRILMQFENGSYMEFYYWAISEDDIKFYLTKKWEHKGPVVRWCYIDDLNKIT